MSPILHDYRPSAESQIKKFNALHWFAVGLGLPLIGIAVLLTLKNASGTNTSIIEDDTVVATAAAELHSTDGQVKNESLAAIEPVPFPAFHPPLLLPPEFEQLILTIKRGDTLDALFRKNKLDLGHLGMIVRLPEAAPHLKRLIPGDQFQIEHDEGSLVSLYRELDLTSALKVSRQESGFYAEIIDRPIEVRRKLAYGKIDTSLFESATAAGWRIN